MCAGHVARCRLQAGTAPSEARTGPPRNGGRQVREPTKEWRLTMRNFLKGLWQDENGAAAAEYALILAVIGAGIAVIAISLGDNIQEAIRLACARSEEHTSELQSLMRISYDVFCLEKKNQIHQ